MLRIPSLTYVGEHAREALRRFPLVFICASLSATLAITLIQTSRDDFNLIKLMMTMGLGIPLFFALTLYSEKPLQFIRPNVLFLFGLGILFLVSFYFLSGQAATENFYFKYFQWSLALHLLVAFSPFFAAGETRGFWQFNRFLFTRFLLSAQYAGVFYLGLVIALVAVDHLLAIKISEKLYFELWVFSAFILMTWHFLAGTPQDLSSLENDDSYPGGLKIFTQYLLVPLVTLYLVILYLYLGRILLSANWPNGTVTWLVSVVSVFGFLNLLLLQPIQEKTENRWIRFYARGFYIALLPLLGMLFVAIGKRAVQYGVTEPRYFATVLGLWVLCIALYFLISKNPTIKTIPITLFILTLFTSLGPWGAYSVSRISQMSRLKSLFVKDGLWNGAKAVKASREIPLQDRKEISSILDYLVENHGVVPLQPWFDIDLSKWKNEMARTRYGYSSITEELCKSLGFDYLNQWGMESGGEYFSYDANDDEDAFSVKGYDWIVPFEGPRKFKLEGQEYNLSITQSFVSITAAGETDMIFDLSKILEGLDKSKSEFRNSRVPSVRLRLDSSNGHWVGLLQMRSLNGFRRQVKPEMGYSPGVLFLRRLK